MTLLICIPLIAVIVGLAARRWFVAVRRDIRSIESHRSNLDHLEHLGSGDAGGPSGTGPGSAHVRIVGRPATQPAQAVRPMVWAHPDGRPPAARPAWHVPRPEPARSRYEQARVEAVEAVSATAAPGAAVLTKAVVEERPLIVITDAAFPAPPPLPASAVTPVPTGSPPVPTGALKDPRSRTNPLGSRVPARMLAAAAGVLVVTAGAGAALLESHPTPAGHLPAAVPAHVASPPARPPAGAARSVRPALTATSTTPTYAIYTVTAGSLRLSLAASGPCWVEIRDGSPGGPVSYVGTLASGASQTFTTASGVWLRLGDPARVQLRINGSPIPLPAAANPFDVTVSTA